MAVTAVLVNCSPGPRYQLRMKQMLFKVGFLLLPTVKVLLSVPSGGRGVCLLGVFSCIKLGHAECSQSLGQAIFK